MSKWKVYDNSFSTWIDKRDLVLRKITQKNQNRKGNQKKRR